MRDAGDRRHRVQSHDCNSWIAASGKLQHSGNNHCSARKRDDIGNRESLSDYAADDESTDPEMNLRIFGMERAHFGGLFFA